MRTLPPELRPTSLRRSRSLAQMVAVPGVSGLVAEPKVEDEPTESRDRQGDKGVDEVDNGIRSPFGPVASTSVLFASG